MRNAVVYDLCRRIREPSFSSIHTLTRSRRFKKSSTLRRHFRKPTFFCARKRLSREKNIRIRSEDGALEIEPRDYP